MENRLREVLENKEMLEAILKTIDEGIHVVNKDGITIFYNHVAARLDGLKVEEVIGKHVIDVFPSLDQENSTLLKVIETGQPIINQNQQYTNKNGLKVTAINTTLPIYVQDKLIGAIEIAKDFTRIKELSERLVDLQAKYLSRNNKDDHLQQAKFHFEDIITQNQRVENLKKLAQKAAMSKSTILIEGETGTGKELFVQAIHNYSPRANDPFIAQNCAAMPASLLEGILFGTVKGSFTGAENRPGLFELANNGTLFLDEINSMPIELQAKLLRVLQDGLVRRIGDNVNRQVNVRIIVATNINPLIAVEKGLIRPDLYYRINVIHLHIPPFRERKEDISILTTYFIQTFNYSFQKKVIGVSEEVQKFFYMYDWPGNVRELKHAIEYAMNVMEGDTIQPNHLPIHLQELFHRRQYKNVGELEKSEIRSPWEYDNGLKELLEEIEKDWINRVLEEESGNIMQTAKRLKIPRQTLQYKLGKYF